MTLLFLHPNFLIGAIFICLTDLHQLTTAEVKNSFYLRSEEISFDMLRWPQSRTVLSESASYLLIFLLSKTMSLISQIIWCVWTWSHRHTIPVRGSRLWELLFSTVNTIKIWERQNSNPIFFHLSWAPLSSPQFFPPKFNPNTSWTPRDGSSNSHMSECLAVCRSSRPDGGECASELCSGGESL